MIDIHYLDWVFKVWEVILMIKNPPDIKRVRMMIDFEDTQNDGPLLMGIIRIYLETDSSYAVTDYLADVEPYYDDNTRETAKEILIMRMKNTLEIELDRVEYEHFWEYFNTDDIMWRKKEG